VAAQRGAARPTFWGTARSPLGADPICRQNSFNYPEVQEAITEIMQPIGKRKLIMRLTFKKAATSIQNKSVYEIRFHKNIIASDVYYNYGL